eukprot:2625198-Pleurochrysis_carterae.AAC.1
MAIPRLGTASEPHPLTRPHNSFVVAPLPVRGSARTTVCGQRFLRGPAPSTSAARSTKHNACWLQGEGAHTQ